MAKKFPDTRFAITDYPVEAAPFADKKGTPLYQNVEGLTYAANESGCLVGVLAAKMAQRMGKKVIGAVMGLKIPPVDIWTAGYKFCAQKAVPGTKVLTGYSQDFVATDKCKTVAENQIADGAGIVFQVAGGCGLGVLDAAKQRGVWGIGVDADQSYLGPQVLTSAMKRVDNDVFTTVQQVLKGQFHGGETFEFSLKNDGVGMGKVSSKVPQDVVDKVTALEPKIANGSIKVPSTVS
jgi:basic membrane protein A